MRVRVATDTKALGALAAQLSTVASGNTARAIMRETAAELEGRVLRQFETGRGPYGNAWPQPKKGNPPGRDTERLMRNIRVRPSGNRILLSASGVTYAGYFSRHAGGIFPDASIGLPASWKQAIDDIVRRNVRAKLRGAR